MPGFGWFLTGVALVLAVGAAASYLTPRDPK